MDAAGTVLHTVERIPELEQQARAAEAIRVDFTVAVEGKKLLRARYPLTISLELFDLDGQRTPASQSLER